MKSFFCKHCSQVLLFNNSACVSCGASVGFDSERLAIITLKQSDGSNELIDDKKRARKRCANYQHGVCNWMVEKDTESAFCLSCRFNRFVPSPYNERSRGQWQNLQDAKHQLFYSLLKAKLPLVNKDQNSVQGLGFDFIDQGQPTPHGVNQTTGHYSGQITINALEANPYQREQTRLNLGENYRTLIGHFRHEIGHYYWELLIEPNTKRLEKFRELFGDEREDYQTALNRHYQSPKQQWQDQYISRYASAHPWEDWAETWAHYFHILDTAETAHDFGISLSPRNRALKNLKLKASFDPYRHKKFKSTISVFHAMVFAANSLNRSMGQPDLYPFVIAPAVSNKLLFVHQIVRERHKKLAAQLCKSNVKGKSFNTGSWEGRITPGV